MGETTDRSKLREDLGTALGLQARDALACALAAGTMAGPQGVAFTEALREMARGEVADTERLAARIVSLEGTPTVAVDALEAPVEWRPTLEWLAALQRETLEAMVAAIPADADDAEGEATEHLLEHMIARKRDTLEVLERGLR